VRMFCAHIPRLQPKGKDEDARLLFGNPPFAVRRVRLSGVVVYVQEGGASLGKLCCRLLHLMLMMLFMLLTRTNNNAVIDDSTGLATLHCSHIPSDRVLALTLGCPIDVLGTLVDDGTVTCESIIDRSGDSLAGWCCFKPSLHCFVLTSMI
jgi:hypothetical protein